MHGFPLIIMRKTSLTLKYKKKLSSFITALEFLGQIKENIIKS